MKDDWSLIEARYGHQIPDEARTAISDATNKFLRLALAEEDAPLKNDALKRLRNLKNRTVSLHKAINELPITDPIRDYVDEQIAFAYSISQYENATPILEYISSFERDLERFSKACQDTITFLSNHDFWPTGGAWDVWIRQLRTILNRHDLPASARKDSDKAKSDKASQFVELVDTLQGLMPERFQRSMHSKFALATAIHNARRFSRPLASRKESPVGSDKS